MGGWSRDIHPSSCLTQKLCGFSISTEKELGGAPLDRGGLEVGPGLVGRGAGESITGRGFVELMEKRGLHPDS
jgi:hypothetical protein